MRDDEYRSILGRIAAALALSVVVAGLAAGAASAEQRKPVRLATLAPQGSSSHQILLAMGEKWRDAPEGGVKIIVNAGGLMGGEADVVAKMRAGQVHAGLLTAVGIGMIDPSVLAIQNLPMMFRSLDEVTHVREKLRPDLERRLLDKGIVVLFWGDVGWVKFFSRTPVVRPADLQKIKVFVWSGSTGQVDLMKSLGLKPVPLEPSDILTSLQTGLIDAVPAAPYYAQVLQYYQPAPHMLDLAWAPLVGALVISKKMWDGYPPALQAAMRAAAVQAGDELTARNRKESDEAVAAMQKRGLVVHAVTPAIEAEWRAFVEPLYPKLRGMEIPEAMFDEVQRVLAEYRRGSAKPEQPEKPKAPEPPR